MRVSICIPTFQRTDFLKVAIDSCLRQSYPPFEIIIGDDSTNHDTETLIHTQFKDATIPVLYFRNQPSQGERRNADDLFKRTIGDAVMLLHDDDWLLPNALSVLIPIMEKRSDVIAVYGKQKIASDEGIIDDDASFAVNKAFHRTSERSGQQSPLRAGATAQFPNDGYLVRGDIARNMGYYTGKITRRNPDFLFGLQLGLKFEGRALFWFVDEFTAVYRKSSVSMSRSQIPADGVFEGFKLIEQNLLNSALKHGDVQSWLREQIPVIIVSAAQTGDWKQSLRLYFSPWHRGRILSLGGLNRLRIIVQAALAAWIASSCDDIE